MQEMLQQVVDWHARLRQGQQTESLGALGALGLNGLTNSLGLNQESLEPVTVRPTRESLLRAVHDLPRSLAHEGVGSAAALGLVLDVIAPATSHQLSPRYFGFVTGGATPSALAADVVVSLLDQNVQVHLPYDSIATHVEALALDMAADLINIDARSVFTGKTLTTGATASNILGLACGREHVVGIVMERKGFPAYSCADNGLAGACRVVVLHVHGHASIAKAASLLGIGRLNCINMAVSTNETSASCCDFDLELLENAMRKYQAEDVGVIVVPSYGEVNTGAFTSNLEKVSALCREYGAWMHIDAAFGAFAPSSTHLHLADSITTDAHKWLNVPYDCGLFYTRSRALLQRVCTPSFDLTLGGPAYLLSSTAATGPPAPTTPPSLSNNSRVASFTTTTTTTTSAANSTDDNNFNNSHNMETLDIANPLTVGIENSRRWRGLPLYASLVALGRHGYEQIFAQNLAFANRVARWVDASREYELLNRAGASAGEGNGRGDEEEECIVAANIVLFCCTLKEFSGKDGNALLVERINSTREVYVSGTVWGGKAAVRIAVSNWRTGGGGPPPQDRGGGGDEDFDVLIGVLKRVLK